MKQDSFLRRSPAAYLAASAAFALATLLLLAGLAQDAGRCGAEMATM